MKKFLAVLVTALLMLIPILLMMYHSPYAICLIAVPAVIMPVVLCEVFSN
jgi:hypothetical protein